jgi:hypothetical protein
MRWLALYLRSRRATVALAGGVGLAVVMWSAWLVSSTARDVGLQMVILTLLLLVICLTASLSGPDDVLEKTAAFSWAPRRITHLLVAFLVIVVLLLLTLPTGARFGPAWLVVRDVGGLLGLTALGAATIGTHRAWFVPLAWTLAAILYSNSEAVLGEVLTWQSQHPSSAPAAVTAGLLALGGLIAYTVAGPALRPPAEATQQ